MARLHAKSPQFKVSADCLIYTEGNDSWERRRAAQDMPSAAVAMGKPRALTTEGVRGMLEKLDESVLWNFDVRARTLPGIFPPMSHGGPPGYSRASREDGRARRSANSAAIMSVAE